MGGGVAAQPRVAAEADGVRVLGFSGVGLWGDSMLSGLRGIAVGGGRLGGGGKLWAARPAVMVPPTGRLRFQTLSILKKITI